MSLILPLMITLLFFIITSYWNYDKFSEVRKKIKVIRKVVPEPFVVKKHNFIIYCPSNSGKTIFIKDFCSLFNSVYVFDIDENEWLCSNIHGVDELKLLDNINNFANSLIIFDDIGENIRLPAIDSFCSKGRYHNINIICVGHTVTDLNTKARKNTPVK